jgi:hypothetical protein
MTVCAEIKPMCSGLLRFVKREKRTSLAWGIALASLPASCEPDWDELVSENRAGSEGVSLSGSSGAPAVSGSSDGGVPPLLGGAGESSGAVEAGGAAGFGGAAGGEGGTDGGVLVVTNLALGRTVTASSEESAKGNYAANAIDGKEDTRWCANDGTPGHWLRVDLGAAYTLTGAEVFWEKADTKYKYTIEVSSDDVAWTNVIDQSMNDIQAQTATHALVARARYVRVTTVSPNDPIGSWASIFELRVMGDSESGAGQ